MRFKEEETTKADETQGFVFSKLKNSFPEKSAKLEEFQNTFVGQNQRYRNTKGMEITRNQFTGDQKDFKCK